MREAVVVGGGLSGLLAAYRLQQANIATTLIEVKGRLGGSLHTVEQEGFILDSGPALFQDGEWSLLDELGLNDALYPVRAGVVAFKGGAQTLIDALAARLQAPRLLRMALSSLGPLDDAPRYGLCLENGLLLDARAVVVALPARYAARVLRSSAPEASETLLDYHYDHLLRLSLAYPAAALADFKRTPYDMAYPFWHRFDAPHRAPEGHVLLQIGVRLDPQSCQPEAVAACVPDELGLPQPLFSRVDVWPEADPLSCYDDDHAATMRALREALPPGLALIGSDYGAGVAHQGVVNLHDRLQRAESAAQDIIAYLRG